MIDSCPGINFWCEMIDNRPGKTEKEGEKRQLVLFRKLQLIIRLFPISRRQFCHPTGVSLQSETRGHGKESFKLAYETVPAHVDL